MKKPNISMLALLLLLCTAAARGQEILNAKTNVLSLSEFFSQKDQLSAHQAEDKFFLYLKFSKIPTGKLLQQLKQHHIELLSYHSDKTYLVAVPQYFLPSQLVHLGIQSVATPEPHQKLSKAVRDNNLPTWSPSNGETVSFAINFHPGTSAKHIDGVVQKFEISETQTRFGNGTLVLGDMPKKYLEALSALPTVAAIDYVQEPDQMLNFECRMVQGVNAVQNVYSGLDLQGDGVTIGIGDGGELGTHPDLETQVINKASGTYSSFGAHGDHVAGIVKGGGIVNPRHRGLAPAAEIITQKTSLITYKAAEYHEEYDMVLTNNSYGPSSNCESNGKYNYSSQSLDKQLNELPEVLHIYAAGNNGWETCGDFPKSYHTVLRYYQSAKNVLTVGNVVDTRVINANSSRGPLLDGRLKPEICGVGTNVMSTDRENGYWNATGTSMSSPAVAATIGLMYQRYRENNGGLNPSGALMKAIACNSAEDLGNPGPDFTYGFGLINARNAVEVIDKAQFETAVVENSETKEHTITIPAGVEKVKVMLYWNDKEADANTAVTALVNDLDLEVLTTDGVSYLPWVLNPAPANVEDVATRAADHLNNIEQVTIDNPKPGNYTFRVKGFDVPFGPQNYVITYQFISSRLEVVYPIGGEGLDPGVIAKIRWDAEETNTQEFVAEASVDGGNSWTIIKDNIAPTERVVSWLTPSTVSEKALIRITKKETGESDLSDATFSLLKSPYNLVAESICAGQIDLSWGPVSGAAAYEIVVWKNEELIVAGRSTDTSFIVNSGLNIGQQYWFSVRAVGPANTTSERSVAIPATPAMEGDCDWDNDANLYSGMKELRGREKLNSALGEAETISVEIENIGTNDLTDFKLYYQVNEETPVSEEVTTVITPGERLFYNFQKKADLSAAKEYEIYAWIEIPGDSHLNNDRLQEPIVAVQLEHTKTNLPVEESFDKIAMGTTFRQRMIGPEGLTKWDLNLGDGSVARIEKSDEDFALTFGNTGTEAPEYKNQAILNLELSQFRENGEDIFLDFIHKSNNDIFTLTDKVGEDINAVYVRGEESLPWVWIMTLPYQENWTEVQAINIAQVLKEEGQSFSSSTQLMFEQKGSIGLSLDKLSLSTSSRLPITLDTFTAQKIGNNAKLKWRTLSEHGNDFFAIEMAEGADAVMNGDFRIIGKVEGKGYSTTPTEYEFIDDQRNKKGERYYRLKQVDFGGKATNSDFRVVNFSMVQLELSFFPNPFEHKPSISYRSEAPETTTIRIYDAKGSLMKEYDQAFDSGRQEMPLNFEENWPGGLYSVQVLFADKTIKNYRIAKIIE